MQHITTPLVELLTPLLMALASLAVVTLTNWLRKQAAVTDSRWANEVLSRVEAEALSVVRDLDQTLVPAMRRAAADGKFTPEEVAELRTLALARMKQRFGPKELARLANADTIESYLKSKLEAAVAENKAMKPTTLSTTVGETLQ